MLRYCLVFLALLLSTLVHADDRPELEILLGGPGANEITIAIPPALGAGADKSVFVATVRRDLELSGWFNLADPNGYLEATGTGLEPGQFRFQDWLPTGAMVLAKTRIENLSGKLRAEVWIYDVGTEEKLGAKAFSASAGNERLLAHKVASEIMLRVTGEQSPFNTRFAVTGTFSGTKEIYLVDFDGGSRQRLTRNGSINLQPAWSSDGKRIAFTSYQAGNPDLYIASLDSGRIRRISARSGINSGAAWRPGSNQISLTMSPNGDPDIYTIDAGTGAQLKRLTRRSGIDASPAWSPDGKQVAFVSERSGGAQIYVMNADGSGVRRVTFKGYHNTDPTWSPDGRQLAFVSRDGNFDVFTVKLDGTNLTRITQGEGNNEDPSWSPDGKYIAYSSTRGGSPHIWLSSSDGRHQAQLTQGSGGYTNPSWSPIPLW